MSRAGFIAGLKARARALKADIHALALAAVHPGTPWHVKALLVAIVAYALSPIDLIPDFIPVLGLLDDLILLPLAIRLAVRMVPEEILDECRIRAREQRSGDLRYGRVGAMVVVLVWVAVAVAVGVWIVRLTRATSNNGGQGQHP